MVDLGKEIKQGEVLAVGRTLNKGIRLDKEDDFT
jgi:hypothetical protein